MADKCTPVRSSWLTHVGTFNGRLFCVFKNGVCCWYPNTDESYYDLALAYASKGHYVHAWLYKILPYQLIKNPCPQILGITVGCCSSPLPRTLYCTIQNESGCACLDGLVVPIAWDGSQFWTGNKLSDCGRQPMSFTFTCPGASPPDCGSFVLYAACNDIASDPYGTTPDAGCTCDPLVLTYSDVNLSDSSCCSGPGSKIRIVVTA